MLQVKHLDQHHRLYLILVTVALFLMLLNSGMVILLEPSSWTYKVARLTSFGRYLGYFYVFSAMCMVPFILTLARDQCSRGIIKLATGGAALGSILCIGLAYVSHPLELRWFSVYHFASGVLCLLVAGALGMVLNTSLARIYRLSHHHSE